MPGAPAATSEGAWRESVEGGNGNHGNHRGHTPEGGIAMLRAKRWGLPYREADAITIDPAACEIVNQKDSNRLSALPLEIREDGPVFAIVEPSEERFAAVRELAGSDASFVVVSQANFDQLTAEVYGVSPVSRRPSLFRGRSAREAGRAEPSEVPATLEIQEPVAVPRSRRPAIVAAAPEEPEEPEESREWTAPETPAAPVPVASPDAVESLIYQITAGTASLTAEVSQLTQSLESAQRELYEAREQLAEAQLANAGHDEIVAALRSENETLRASLAESQSWNASITARLQAVVQALALPEQAAG